VGGTPPISAVGQGPNTSKDISCLKKDDNKRPAMRKKEIAIVIAFLLVAISIGVLFFKRSETVSGPSDYLFESYRYSVDIVPETNATYLLLLPCPSLMSENNKATGDNITVDLTSDHYGPCLKVSGRGNSTLSSSYDAKVSIGTPLKVWTMNLTMTNLSASGDWTRVNNYTARLWSSEDNVSIELSFESDHGRHYADSKWVSAAGYRDLFSGIIMNGWQEVKIERNMWIT
jgi:hypothetical protein